jgi:putative DNA primase/helicase
MTAPDPNDEVLIRLPADGGRSSVALDTADRAQLTAIEWWWRDHIPAGKPGVLDGDPGLGKSLIQCALVASATAGVPLPDGSVPSRIGGAIMFAAEDTYSDTILPRLIAAGADLSRVYVAHAADRGVPIRLPAQTNLLAEYIDKMQAVIVTLDPQEFYFEADIIKGREQRIALAPVLQLISEKGVVLLGNRHLNQQSGQKALYRGRGDITGIGVSRYGFIVGQDPKSDDPDELVMVPHKHNLAPRHRVRALHYRITEQVIDDPSVRCDARIAWGESSEVTADQAVGAQNAAPQTALEVIEREILPLLREHGRLESDECWRILKSFGVRSNGTINRAVAKLGIKPAKDKTAFKGPWYWYPPANGQ